jgi:3-dehydroquinate synthase
MRKEIPISLPEGRSYSVFVEEGLLEHAGELLAGLGVGWDPFVITDSNVADLYADDLLAALRNAGFEDPRLYAILPGEQSKTLSVWSSVLDGLVDYSSSGGRKIFVLAFWGGVVGDLAGFAAAGYRRGIPVVQIATTVIAMVDSAIGGKTGVDHPRAKNLIGTFHQPRAVLIDPTVLATLDDRELRAGLAEVIKYGVIRDPGLYTLLESEKPRILRRDFATWADVIERCVAIKARYVEQDEFDRRGIRAHLNFGHTVGHAWEAALAYGDEIRHGEAVAVGMIAAARIAVRMGLADTSLADGIEEMVLSYGLPNRISGADVDGILMALRLDKKNVSGSHRFVLPRSLGSVEIVEGIEERLIREVVDALQR